MKYICQRDYPYWLYITRTDYEGEEVIRGRRGGSLRLPDFDKLR